MARVRSGAFCRSFLAVRTRFCMLGGPFLGLFGVPCDRQKCAFRLGENAIFTFLLFSRVRVRSSDAPTCLRCVPGASREGLGAPGTVPRASRGDPAASWEHLGRVPGAFRSIRERPESCRIAQKRSRGLSERFWLAFHSILVRFPVDSALLLAALLLAALLLRAHSAALFAGCGAAGCAAAEQKKYV